LGIFIFLGFGLWISYKTWKYTKDNRVKIFGLGYFLVGFGFTLILIVDLHDYFFDDVDTLFGLFDEIAYVVPLFGLFLLMYLYIRNIEYVYRIHFDVYAFVIASKTTGEVIQSYQIRAKNPIYIDPNLVTGFLMGINGLFGEIFDHPRNIHQIAGINANLMFASGERVVAMLLTERISDYLVTSLKQFVRAFEYSFEYQTNLTFNTVDQAVLQAIFSPIFPFFAIESIKEK